MNTLIIQGGRPLFGSVGISGCKNAALPILFAAYMTGDVCEIENVPDIADVRTACDILRALGAEVIKTENGIYLDARNAIASVPLDATADLRGALYLLGASLGRFGKASFGRCGGCDFGGRPINYHLDAFRALGANVSEEESSICLIADSLAGRDIYFPSISVGATVNAMLASVKAHGKTRLCGAAKEPHVVDAVRFLRACGAHICGEGTGCIEIEGVARLHGCRYRIISDMIEAGTFMAACAAAGGKIELRGTEPDDLAPVTAVLKKMGLDFAVREIGTIVCFSDGNLRGENIVTSPFPGFPTDLHPQFGVLLGISKDGGTITESVFEKRFRYTESLRKMGVRVKVCGNSALFNGKDILHGTEAEATDLRAGAALAVAGVVAQGKTVIHGNGYLERGYENFTEKLRKLGVSVSLTDVPSARGPLFPEESSETGKKCDAEKR